jgi:hypothetical protein
MLASILLLLAQQADSPPQPPTQPQSQPPSQPEPQSASQALSQPSPDMTAAFQTQAAVQHPGSSLLNPAMSFILDTDFGYYGSSVARFQALGLPVAGDDPAVAVQGFGVQEVEIAAQAAIDPYLEGAIFLTIPNLDGLEVEEGYLVTTSLPGNLQLKAGTFRSQFSRNNSQHLHMQNFTRRPLLTALLLGPDGLRGPGLQASVLLPLPWYATLYGESFALGPPGDTTVVSTFGGAATAYPDKLTYTAVLEQYWDLTENASLLLGTSFATGKAFDCVGMVPCDPAAALTPRSYLYGGYLYYKWKPANEAKTYASFQWTTEFYARTLAGEPNGTVGAGYTEGVLQFARRWYAGLRLEGTGLPSGVSVPRRFGAAGSLTFAPSEFSRIRLYLQELAGPGVDPVTVGFVQAEYSMGAHGAHPF